MNGAVANKAAANGEAANGAATSGAAPSPAALAALAAAAAVTGGTPGEGAAIKLEGPGRPDGRGGDGGEKKEPTADGDKGDKKKGAGAGRGRMPFDAEPGTDLFFLQKRLDQVLRQIKACNDAMRRRSPLNNAAGAAASASAKPGTANGASAAASAAVAPGTAGAGAPAAAPSSSAAPSGPGGKKGGAAAAPARRDRGAAPQREAAHGVAALGAAARANVRPENEVPIAALAIVCRCLRRGLRHAHRIQRVLDAVHAEGSAPEGAPSADGGAAAPASVPAAASAKDSAAASAAQDGRSKGLGEALDALMVLEALGIVKPEHSSRSGDMPRVKERLEPSDKRPSWCDRFFAWACAKGALGGDAEVLRAEQLIGEIGNLPRAPEEREKTLKARLFDQRDAALAGSARGLLWVSRLAADLEDRVACDGPPRSAREEERSLPEILGGFGDKVPKEYLREDVLAAFQRKGQRRRRAAHAETPKERDSRQGNESELLLEQCFASARPLRAARALVDGLRARIAGDARHKAPVKAPKDGRAAPPQTLCDLVARHGAGHRPRRAQDAVSADGTDTSALGEAPVLQTRTIKWEDVAKRFEVMEAVAGEEHPQETERAPASASQRGGRRARAAGSEAGGRAHKRARGSVNGDGARILVAPQFRKVERRGDGAESESDASDAEEDLSDQAIMDRHAQALQEMRDRVQDILRQHAPK